MDCGCAVDMSIECDGYSDILEHNIKTAIKEHKCEECNCKISSGSKYEFYKGVYEGDVFTHKTCSDCLSIRKIFFKKGFYFGMILENLSEFIEEAEGQIYEECLSKLTPKARKHVCDIIDKKWKEYWLENPTQFAARLSKMIESISFMDTPGWIISRRREVNEMDNAIFLQLP